MSLHVYFNEIIKCTNTFLLLKLFILDMKYSMVDAIKYIALFNDVLLMN